jgi:hypothetical protein
MMNSAQVRQLARAHGQAVVASDTKKIMVDVVSELHDQIPQLASALPEPLTAPRVLSVDVFDDHAETLTEYTGPGSAVTVKARWEDRGAGRPQIVAATPA